MTGALSYFGWGVPRNSTKAFGFYQQAERKGLAVANTTMALILREGDGVAADPEQAVERLRSAVARKDKLAFYHLAEMYALGWGVDQDFTEAFRLFTLSAENGLPEAQLALGSMYERGQSVPVDYARARECYRRAAESGSPTAVTALGLLYERGLGVARNETRSVALFTMSAGYGDPMGMNILAHKLFRGNGTRRDPLTAAFWTHSAMLRGDPAAPLLLPEIEAEIGPARSEAILAQARAWQPVHPDRIELGF
jgi:TPR repeat protein